LLGANGAGKTTTINLFLGFLEATAGEALVDGVAVRADPTGTKRKLLYVPEQIALFGDLTGLENLEYFAALSGIEDRASARLRECLEQAGLARDAMDRRANGYSKGMRQKVGLALAIAKQARGLLLDEPTSGLDPQASAEFHDLIVRQRDAGAAVLMVTHDLFRAREVANRIGIMRAGRLTRFLSAGGITATDLERIYIDEMNAGRAAVLA
jgi:ABC-2 type transport system ATP-binding protein